MVGIPTPEKRASKPGRRASGPRPGRVLAWGGALAVLLLIGIGGHHILAGWSNGGRTPSDAGPPADLPGSDRPSESAVVAMASVQGLVIDPQGLPAGGALVWAVDLFGHLHQTRT